MLSLDHVTALAEELLATRKVVGKRIVEIFNTFNREDPPEA